MIHPPTCGTARWLPGTIGAVGDNDLGVVGVNWKVSLLPLKALRADTTVSVADAIAAIEYATAIGVDVINASWGGSAFSQALLDEIEAAARADVLFVAAAGNLGIDNDLFPYYPASYQAPNIIAGRFHGQLRRQAPQLEFRGFQRRPRRARRDDPEHSARRWLRVESGDLGGCRARVGCGGPDPFGRAERSGRGPGVDDPGQRRAGTQSGRHHRHREDA